MHMPKQVLFDLIFWLRNACCNDRTVQPPLFRDRSSNCTNLFWPEPNRTRHRIFAFVSLLFDNLQRLKCCTHTFTIWQRYI